MKFRSQVIAGGTISDLDTQGKQAYEQIQSGDLVGAGKALDRVFIQRRETFGLQDLSTLTTPWSIALLKQQQGQIQSAWWILR